QESRKYPQLPAFPFHRTAGSPSAVSAFDPRSLTAASPLGREPSPVCHRQTSGNGAPIHRSTTGPPPVYHRSITGLSPNNQRTHTESPPILSWQNRQGRSYRARCNFLPKRQPIARAGGCGVVNKLLTELT